MNMETPDSASPTPDTIQLEVAVRIDGLHDDAPLCRNLGSLLVNRGRQEDALAEIRALIGVPDQFDVRIDLGDRTSAMESPVIVDPPVLPDVTIRAQDCVECSAYSWSKGCSSWPW